MGSLDNSFGFESGVDVENGIEGGGKLICKVGGIKGWVCVERGSDVVSFMPVLGARALETGGTICQTKLQ